MMGWNPIAIFPKTTSSHSRNSERKQPQSLSSTSAWEPSDWREERREMCEWAMKGAAQDTGIRAGRGQGPAQRAWPDP